MSVPKKYYWMKLKESFMTSDTIDFFMSQPDGANYVVLYQMLCLKTINTGGRLSRHIGEVIIPYDIPKIQRDCKWFSSDTIRVALEMYKAFGLIYEDIDGTLILSDHENLVGSETSYAVQKRNQRRESDKFLPDGGGHLENTGVDIVHPDNRDKDIRDKDIDKKNTKKKADAFSEFADENEELISALQDFERMRAKIKRPLTELAKSRLISKLQKEFSPQEWVAVLNQSVDHCWQGIFPLKDGSGTTAGQTESSVPKDILEQLKRAQDLI